MSNQPVGTDQIDSEHALQVQLLLEIEKALESSQRESASDLLTQLQQFTEAHFATEQILMRLHSYPGYRDHETEHGELLEQLAVLTKHIAADAPFAVAAASSTLRLWLTHHIGTADRAFADYLVTAGQRIAAPV